MDPLSMTASIIAVVGVGGTIGKGLAKIVALRHAPQIVLALNNEIADLQCVVQDIDDLLRRCSEMTDFLPPTISSELTSIKGKRNEAELDRSVWLRAEHKAQKLKDEIRDAMVRLASTLSLLASKAENESTPSHTAAYYDQPNNLSCLLEARVVIDTVGHNGRTPIDVAIVENSHEALAILLQYSNEDGICGGMFRDETLYDAAAWADIETLEVMCSGDLHKIDTKARFEGWTVIELAEWRRDFNEELSDHHLIPRDYDPWEWYAAFERLVASMSNAQRRLDDGISSQDDGDGEESNETGMAEANDDQGDAEEIWEDAPESSHESSR
ncbi:hypothetical protein OEA41_006174 [Lepraria neglecta]|uniref:Fungal N-terminal domain-containing protein n=1 Tax=Lepraria neglecta TaxID=209136 RepID=A0AAD9Z7E4_9LECA|nr:hypothetical protein OEA41_006174 [Lepraria neglecta]